ncbi:MAG: hypothetical protein RR086_02225 [Clostridia bacterium]
MINIMLSYPKERSKLASGNVVLFANGNIVPLKKVSEHYEAKLDITGSYSIQLISRPELSQKHWFVKSLFFWIVGIAGICTPHYDKRGLTLEYTMQGEVVGDDATIELRLLPTSTNECFKQAVFAKGDGVNYTEDNIAYTINSKARKRYRIYTFFNWFFRLLLIAGGAILLFTM